MKGPHLLLQPGSPLLEGWMWYARKDDTGRNGRRMLLPRAGLLPTSTHSSFWPPSATRPQRHQTSSFVTGTLPRHRSEASVMPGMDAPQCRPGGCRNPAEIFHELVVAGSCRTPWGDTMLNCFRARAVGCFQQQWSHSVPHHPTVFRTGRGSDATSSTRPFLLAAEHPIQAQTGKVLGLKFTER